MARRVLLPIVVLAMLAGEALAADQTCDARFDAALRTRAHAPAGLSQVIIRLSGDNDLSAPIRALGGSTVRRISSLRMLVARIPDTALHQAAALPDVVSLSFDRRVHGTADRTAASIGAEWVRQELGVDGKGVGIALIDSGVTAAHDDLDPERVLHFADFVNFRTGHYDDYGHGTHVAGIIAGNGRNSNGARVGVAPGSSLVVLKALDGAGFGYTSNVIAALEYAIANREKFNIRVINLSVAAGVFESYNRDPLTLAARRAVDAGIVVVAAAGNLGRNNLGKAQYGGFGAGKRAMGPDGRREQRAGARRIVPMMKSRPSAREVLRQSIGPRSRISWRPVSGSSRSRSHRACCSRRIPTRVSGAQREPSASRT